MYQQPASSLQSPASIVAKLCIVIVAATPALPMVAIAGGIELDSREYKLMLSPESLPVQSRNKRSNSSPQSSSCQLFASTGTATPPASLRRKGCGSANTELSGSGTAGTACLTEMALLGASGPRSMSKGRE